MRKFAEDDRIELMNQQKRRMKQLEHKKAADALIEERKRIHLQEAELLRKEIEKEREIERYKKEVIEQERQRLLREHASKLVGFLPKVKLLVNPRAFYEIKKISIFSTRNLRINLIECRLKEKNRPSNNTLLLVCQV